MRTGCPKSKDIKLPKVLEMRSVPPPGEKGTMIRMGFSGKTAPRATVWNTHKKAQDMT
jgi:hypothetical protein